LLLAASCLSAVSVSLNSKFGLALLGLQAKVDKATRQVEDELRARADAHATELVKKLERAAALMTAAA
jgi:hypothetical protein